MRSLDSLMACVTCAGASVDGGRWALINNGSHLGQRGTRPHLLQPPRYSSSGIVCYMLATFFRWDFMGASLKDHIKRCGRRSVIVDIGPHLPNIVRARRAVPSGGDNAIPARGTAKRTRAGPDASDPNWNPWRLVWGWQKLGVLNSVIGSFVGEGYSTP